LDNDIKFMAGLTTEEMKLSSGHRELLAVLKTLVMVHSTPGKREPTNVYWITDSENLVSFLSKGSAKINIQRDVFKVWKLARDLEWYIKPIHLLRDDPRIQEADEGSKTVDSDNWSVDDQSFERFNAGIGFTIDLFADTKNAKCDRFYSNFFCEGTMGVDAMAHDWTGETAWVCPPTHLIVKVIRKMCRTKMRALLVFPDWPTAEFWNEVFEREDQIREQFVKFEKWRPFVRNNALDQKSIFSGFTSFEFVAVFFSNLT